MAHFIKRMSCFKPDGEGRFSNGRVRRGLVRKRVEDCAGADMFRVECDCLL